MKTCTQQILYTYMWVPGTHVQDQENRYILFYI